MEFFDGETSVEGKKCRELEAAAKNSLLRSGSSSGDEKITYARCDVIISGEKYSAR
jgi:hypothetical protein